MSRPVSFVDTSILCNLLPVPGRDQDRSAVLTEMKAKLHADETLILPVTAVIETGNFIAQLPRGDVRRSVAQLFSDMLELVLQGAAPWQLHRFMWDDQFLRTLLTGAGTAMTLVEHAVARVGSGDLCILAEREIYVARSGLAHVSIWTADGSLASYS
jgi:hypothetical protein